MATSTKTTTSASLPSNHTNTSPKTLLTIALSKAQDAVQLDGQKKMDEAIMAYQEAADLLSQVMDRAENANNRKKLRQIHQTYTNRIFLLNNSKNSLPNSPGLTSTYNTNGPTLAQTSANRNEENRDKMQTSNIHNLRKKMSAPLLRTSNETHFTAEDSKFSPYLQFSNGFQTSLHSNPPNSDLTSTGLISSRDNSGKNLPGVPESPLTHLLPPTSARLTALSKQLYGPNSVNKETEDTSRMRGESFSERTLPSLERIRESKEAFGHPVLRKQLSSSSLQQDSSQFRFQPKSSSTAHNLPKVPSVPLSKQGSINKRPNRARGYSLSVLNQREYVRETFSTLPPPPFPPPGLGHNKVSAPKKTNSLSDKQQSASDVQKTTVEGLTLHSSPGTPRDSKVDVDLENEEHLDYYLNSESAQCDGSTSTGARTHPIPIQCEKSDGPEGLLPPRSSSLPRKLETGLSNPHRPLPLDISGITLGDDDALDSSKGLRFPPTLKRLGSEQNLYGEFAPETPKSAALKPPTPKFPPPEAIRPFDIKRSDDEESSKVEHHIGDEDSEDQASLLSSTKAVFHRQPPPPLSVITYRPSVSPPATSTQVLRDRPGANGGSIQLASASTLKAENAQRQKGSLAAEHFSARSSILAPNFRRKMSLPVGLGSSNMMRSAVQNTNSSLMPKALNGSPSTLSADPSPTGSYFIHPIRRPYKGLTLFDIVLEEPQEGASLLEQSPQKLELQPFWLMRCFERSMVSGGFISNKMYIPRSLWYQSGARLSAIEAKISACELITATLYNMALSLGQNIPPASTTPVTHFKELDIVILLKELESFDTVLYSVQNNLAKKLSFIESIKKSQSSFLSLGNRITKSLERMTTSRDKIDDVSLYIDVLIKLFQTCQILDHWIKQFHAMSPGELQAQALTRLARVSEFMNTVICAFVMRDLTVLMAKYMKRCKEWLID